MIRRLKAHRARAYRALVSLFVIVVLGAQTATLVATVLLKPMDVWFWPIIDYPMYAPAGYEGDSVDSEYGVFVALDDGQTRMVSKEELGLNVFHFRYLCYELMTRKSLTRFTPLMASLQDHARIREVVVKSSGRVISRDGVVQRAPQVLVRLAVTDELAGL
jgi:hypothetical protein